VWPKPPSLSPRRNPPQHTCDSGGIATDIPQVPRKTVKGAHNKMSAGAAPPFNGEGANAKASTPSFENRGY